MSNNIKPSDQKEGGADDSSIELSDGARSAIYAAVKTFSGLDDRTKAALVRKAMDGAHMHGGIFDHNETVLGASRLLTEYGQNLNVSKINSSFQAKMLDTGRSQRIHSASSAVDAAKSFGEDMLMEGVVSMGESFVVEVLNEHNREDSVLIELYAKESVAVTKSNTERIDDSVNAAYMCAHDISKWDDAYEWKKVMARSTRSAAMKYGSAHVPYEDLHANMRPNVYVWPMDGRPVEVWQIHPRTRYKAEEISDCKVGYRHGYGELDWVPKPDSIQAKSLPAQSDMFID